MSVVAMLTNFMISSVLSETDVPYSQAAPPAAARSGDRHCDLVDLDPRSVVNSPTLADASALTALSYIPASVGIGAFNENAYSSYLYGFH